MSTKKIVLSWFEQWESGDFLNLPVTKKFKHTSPYGTVEGKQEYIELVGANIDKFIGHQFIIHDLIEYKKKACVRYTAIQGDFRLEVSEWHFIKKNKIKEIIAYYNIDEKQISIEDK